MSLFYHKPKVAAEDYDISSLPQSRKEVFTDVCRLHWGKLLLLGGLLLLFALPVFFCAVHRDLTLLLLEEQMEQNTWTPLEAASLVCHALLIYAAIRIPLAVLFSIGLAGVMRMIKRYAWLENVSFSHDFFLGVRQNTRQYAALLLIAGILQLLCTYAHSAIPVLGEGILFVFLSYLPSALCLLFLLPVGTLAIPCVAVYDNKMPMHLRYGSILFLRYGWRVLLAIIICGFPFLLTLLPKLAFRVIGGVVSCLLLPFSLLAWFLFVSELLDRQINQENYPELVDRGLLGRYKETE